MTNRDRLSPTTSSANVGRCAISIAVTSLANVRHMTLCETPRPSVRTRRSCGVAARAEPKPGARGRAPGGESARRAEPLSQTPLLLRVELDDELLLHGGVDDLPRGQPVHEDAHPVRDDLEPGRHRPLAGHRPGDDERGELEGAVPDLDDVVLGHPVARDVDLDPVDEEVAVPHELAGGVAGRGEAGPVDDVVEAGLEDAQEVLAGPAGSAVGLLVVAAELLLEDAVDARGLLLLAHLQQVLALLRARAAVLTRGVGTDLDRALRGLALGPLQEELHLLAPAPLAVRPVVTRHGGGISCRSSSGQTRRRLGGRQPLCGVGVTSWIDPTSRPVA